MAQSFLSHKLWGLRGGTGNPTVCYNYTNQVTLKSHRSHSESHIESHSESHNESHSESHRESHTESLGLGELTR